jgi:hypothetical protein
MPMSNVPQPAVPAEETKKPVLPPSRIVLIVFVIAAAVIIFIELRARLAFTSTNSAVEQAFDEAKDQGRLLTRDEVQEMTSGSPRIDKQADGWEVMIWSGVLQPYELRLQYSDNVLIRMGEERQEE